MLSVALTGNVASGKSTVARLFASWGATVLDADAIVRELQQPGTPTLDAIHDAFGDRILLADGSLDRAALRARMLADPASRTRLESIVHPAVERRRAELVAAARAAGDRIVVSDIPLLFEVLDPAAFDLVVLVDAPEATRRARLVRSRGLSHGEADRLMATQLPAGRKRARSDIVIDNDGSLAQLRARAAQAWQRLLDLTQNAE